ncbi:hypothetical protein PF008_g14372 [Phytophthora fragariae]|uniref:FAM86 N-terminal domain-containing protein n=1 Tax=Phytophthora fragariae TaxID=53985 RepID=A0A6G0RHC5_9STRA|nr:hypothetical protein PF008_g14372 [Phytophthora fragariae]
METALSPLFSFDRDELQRLQEALPKDLQLLWLRLRFGLPVRVVLGQRFRVVVDLVDEMGQAFPKHLTPPEGVDISLVSQSSGVINNQEISSGDVSEIILKIEKSATERRQEAKWVFWASLHSAQGTRVSPIDIRVGLRIQMKQTLPIGGDSYHYRRLLQTFCVGSAWLDEHVLVLPLQVELQVLNTSDSNDSSLSTSTVCQRLFRFLPSKNSTTEASTDERDLLTVEEHYGDAMGAHVWDASILLSWAVLQAGARASTSPEQDNLMGKANMKQTILELGSGCGLFAAVLARVKPSHQLQTIFTEKSECTHRLQTNLDRNGSPPSASVLALEWGAPLPSLLRDANVRVVFAADVLYNWAAHEVFLATLDGLVQEQQANTKLHVFVAHKRRGKASAEKLDALALGTFDPASMCGTSAPNFTCRWTQWRVDKLSSLGRVDLLKLSRRFSCGAKAS